MAIFKSIIQIMPSSQEICEINLWNPPQGSIKEAVPLSLDLDFHTEEVVLPCAKFDVFCNRATIYLKLTDAVVVRGSRLGEHVHDPSMVEDVTQSVRVSIENETEAEGRIEVTVQKIFSGKLTGFVKRIKRKSKKAERDHIIKTATRISRISPRPKLKWDIVEPVAPNYLKGRYIGIEKEKEIGPLCLITMEKDKCSAEVKVAIKKQDLIIRNISVLNTHVENRNKQAVIEQVVRRSLMSDQLSSPGTSVAMDHNSVLFCSGRIGIEIEDI